MKLYKERTLGPHILRLSRSFPVVLLTGARQVGKTTLLKHLAGQRRRKYRYVSLDEFETRTFAKNDPRIFLEQYPAPLIIDEIQYAPQLLSYLKAAVDRGLPMGSYWLTGSQQFHMMKNVSESLAGRVGIARMLGLSQAEEKARSFSKAPWSPGRKADPNPVSSEPILSIFKKIIRGSFPSLFHHNAPSLDSFYGAYIQTYIDRDLRDLVKVSSLSAFEKFVRACAARTASILNLSDLARDSDISVNTAKEWLSLLEAGDQIFLLKPYHRNLSKRLVKAPKLYFFDTGLASYLTGWREPDITAKGAFSGPLFETFVVSEILKSYYHRGLEPRAYYYRTKDGAEVDLLIEKNGILMPVEIKLSSLIRSGDVRGIDHLQKMGFSLGAGAVFAAVHEPYALRRGLSVVPPSSIS